MIELFAADKWIKETLIADLIIAQVVGDRLFRDAAPDGVVFPFLLFNSVASSDFNTLGGVRARAEIVYDVAISSRGNSRALIAEAVEQIDVLMQGHLFSANGYRIYGVREATLDRPETQGDTFYRTGGTYRLTLRKE